MPLKILALRALYESRQLVVEHEGVAQTHHLQASGGYSEVELHRLRGDQGNALDNPEASVDEFVFGDNVINDANAERFLGVDVVARQGIAERVLVASVEGPEEVRVGDHAHFGLRKDSVLGGVSHVA